MLKININSITFGEIDIFSEQVLSILMLNNKEVI
jgi:hypothetical protein